MAFFELLRPQWGQGHMTLRHCPVDRRYVGAVICLAVMALGCDRDATVRGKVTLNGDPVSGLSVELKPSSSGKILVVTTDSRGTFSTSVPSHHGYMINTVVPLPMYPGDCRNIAAPHPSVAGTGGAGEREYVPRSSKPYDWGSWEDQNKYALALGQPPIPRPLGPVPVLFMTAGLGSGDSAVADIRLRCPFLFAENLYAEFRQLAGRSAAQLIGTRGRKLLALDTAGIDRFLESGLGDSLLAENLAELESVVYRDCRLVRVARYLELGAQSRGPLWSWQERCDVAVLNVVTRRVTARTTFLGPKPTKEVLGLGELVGRVDLSAVVTYVLGLPGRYER